MLTRRTLLKAAGAGALGLVLGPDVRSLASPPAAGSPASAAGFLYCSLVRPSQVSVTPFQAALPIIPTLAPRRSDATTDYYRVTMAAASASFLPGVSTPICGYEGRFPGPIIRATRGRRVVVEQVNKLPFDTTVHLHGGHVGPADDGHPLALIAPQKSRTYHYENDQAAATLWYHDHVAMATGPHVYSGLAGVYIVGDDEEAALDLPRGRQDIALVLSDRIFDADGTMWYPAGHTDGLLGDVLLVNGAPHPRAKVATRLYRLRFVNASNCRVYCLALGDGRPLTQIATDAGLLAAPVPRSSIDLGPGERVEVVVDFTNDPIGTQVVLHDLYGAGQMADMMRFDVVREEAETVVLPPVLRTITPPGLPTTTRTFDLMFSSRKGWVINGEGFDANRVDAYPVLGDTEVWQFTNRTGLAHPMHLHLVSFLILDRDGLPPEPGEAGWKDTVLVHPSETVRVIAQFTDYTGRYVYHCHNLEHEDHDMMGQFEVVATSR